jgi:16S rRNA (uracil1498-N3)-methyltransferase
MPIPFFYFASLAKQDDEFALDENSSRHVVQVLRMNPGENLRLTDGKGLSALASIRESNKKRCLVDIKEKQIQEPPKQHTQIALSLLKNTNRFEWFLEKATELGIGEIVPLKCMRTEKQQFRMDRMHGILESALIQSQQVWMPVLHEPTTFQMGENARADRNSLIEPGNKTLSEMLHTRPFTAYRYWTEGDLPKKK